MKAYVYTVSKARTKNLKHQLEPDLDKGLEITEISYSSHIMGEKRSPVGRQFESCKQKTKPAAETNGDLMDLKFLT